jgi:hypothetical protein
MHYAISDIFVWDPRMYFISNICIFYSVISISGDVMGLLTDYLHKDLPLDIESVFKGATCLRNLQHTLGTTCQGLNRLATIC